MAEEITLGRVYDCVKGMFDHAYQLTNSYVFAWESDYFGIAKGSGYVYEIEVKMSKSDFKADFKKVQKHLMLKSKGRVCSFKGHTEYDRTTLKAAREIGFELEKHHQQDYQGNIYPDDHTISMPVSSTVLFKKPLIPNRFYYACPKGLIDKKDIPEYAGLIYVDRYSFKIIKKAPLIHKEKIKQNINRILLDKFYYKYLGAINSMHSMERDIDHVKNQFELITDEEYEQKSIEFD